MKFIYFAVLLCLLASAVFSADSTTTPGAAASTTDKSTATTKATTATTAKSTATSTAKTTATTAKTTATTAKTTATTAKTTVTTAKTTATTTKTTTVPTTTVAPPPTDVFELKENHTVCFLAKISAEFTVTYNKTDNSTGTAVIAIPKADGVKYKGSCASDMIPKPFLTLEFEGYTAQLNFSQTGGRVYLQSLSFQYKEDPANFPNATDPTTEQTAENPNVTLEMSSNTTFFQCNTPLPQKVNDAVTLTFDLLKVQVYNVKGNFSGEGEACAGDKTSSVAPKTSTIAPTSTPKPTLPDTPKSGNWSVQDKDGMTCMVATMGARFEIPYMDKANKSLTAKFDVPEDATTDGSMCGKKNTTDSDTFQLHFFKNFILKMIFTTVKSSAKLTADDEYHLQNISLTYYLDEEHFPKHSGDPAKALMITNNDEHFKVALGKSYKCNTKVEIKMSDNAVLDTYNLQVQAFKTSNGTGFDDFTECTADNATSNIVPIAVGAALAALVVIVLIAYVIGRRRSRSGYESV